VSLTVEALATAISQIDDIDPEFAAMIATGLLPFIERHIAAGQQGEQSDLLDDLARIYATIPVLPVTAETAEEATNALLAFCYLPAVRKALDLQIPPPAPLGDAEDYLRPLRNAIDTADAYATGGPRNLRIVTLRMDEAEAMLARASLATPQPPKPAADVPSPDSPIMKWADAAIALRDAKPAGDVPLPMFPIESEGSYWSTTEIEVIRAYGDAREAAGRADAVPDGFVLSPHFRGFAHLGLGRYRLSHSRAGVEAELSIVPATPEEVAGRAVGDLRDDGPDEIPAELMAVRLRFENVAGLDALEQQLRLLRETHFPQQPAAEGDLVLIERGLIGAACSAIDKKRDAPNLLAKLRAVTFSKSDPAAVNQPMTTQGEDAGREAVVTTLVYDPEDESGDGPWFSLQDWARLRELPPGTKLYTNPSPVADAEAQDDTEARKLYSKWTDSHDKIHCNRFPSWSDLGEEDRAEWRDKAARLTGPQS